MLALKIVGFLLLGVVALLLVLLALPLRLVVFTKGEHALCVQLRILFFKLNLAGSRPQKQKKLGAAAKKQKNQGKLSLWQRFKAFLGLPPDEQVQKLQAAVQAKGTASQLRQIADLLKPALLAASRVLKKLMVRQLWIQYIGGGDAAEAAMNYGLACAVLYPLCELVQQLPNTAKNAVTPQLGCNYNAPKATFLFRLTVSVRVFYLAVATAEFLKQYLKRQPAK